ncbi:hypothetical protein Peur_012592 [Populus x canadensis]
MKPMNLNPHNSAFSIIMALSNFMVRFVPTFDEVSFFQLQRDEWWDSPHYIVLLILILNIPRSSILLSHPWLRN